MTPARQTRERERERRGIRPARSRGQNKQPRLKKCGSLIAMAPLPPPMAGVGSRVAPTRTCSLEEDDEVFEVGRAGPTGVKWKNGWVVHRQAGAAGCGGSAAVCPGEISWTRLNYSQYTSDIREVVCVSVSESVSESVLAEGRSPRRKLMTASKMRGHGGDGGWPR
ncbi:hypothetical protein LX36DRAFT_357311 [Colletotrichum falcatum]|nr:hypothetical protein LX36DRAFT_357311 [Colletotrichum falcatum]